MEDFMSLHEYAGFNDLDKDPRTLWVAQKHHTQLQHAYYIILRGVMRKEVNNLDIVRRLQKQFGPVTNKRKLCTGRREYDTLFFAMISIAYPGYKHLGVSEDQHEMVKKKANELKAMVRYRV
jgi:hypothetical protein